MQKYKDLKAQAKAERDQALKEKAFVDGRLAEEENQFEASYNAAIISAIAEMRKLKHFIYQAGYEYGLKKAQVPANHEL